MTAPEAFVRDGGSIKSVLEMYVRDGGSVKEVLEGWVKDGGNIKKFFASDQGCVFSDITMTIGVEAPIFVTMYTYMGHDYTYSYDARGFDGGYDYWYGDGFGSLSDNTYVDCLDVTRTFEGLEWVDHVQFGTANLSLVLIGGASTPNDDDVFRTITVDGTEFVRSAATATGVFASTGRYWRWGTTGPAPFGTSGNVTVSMKLGPA